MLKTRKSPWLTASLAMLLVLTTPVIVYAASAVAARSSTFAKIASPVVALQAEKKASSAFASLAVLVGVSALIGAVLVLMGIVR